MSKKYLMGLDIGSSSVKASLLDIETGELAASAGSPKTEMKITSNQPGWAEQHPELWWENIVIAVKEMTASLDGTDYEIDGIGITYQMHGLVMVDADQNVLYPSIIWCDSRAVEIGAEAFEAMGEAYCLENYLNSPGNFTASKLKWVKENEPEIFSKVDKIMLPGDYVAMKLTGEVSTTKSGLSEGILWNFKENRLATELLEHYGISSDVIPTIYDTFCEQGTVNEAAAAELGIKAGIKIGYRAGDQPNNALSLNVLNPGEIAATAGTSGVVYGITADNAYDSKSRVNGFAHVNYTDEQQNKGILLCINGTGILNSWLRNEVFGQSLSYPEMNELAASSTIGANGVKALPYGNGAERSLGNVEPGASFSGINLNRHGKGDLIRAAQEGIAFAFNYGVEVMKEMGMDISLLRAGHANMFLSEVFQEAVANTCNVKVELYNTDGSQGACRGAGIGLGVYASAEEAFDGLKVIKTIEPDADKQKQYAEAYAEWKKLV